MDRPDELFCYACRANVGYVGNPASLTTCKCGKILRQVNFEYTVDAEPEFITLIRKLERLEEQYLIDKRELQVRVGGSRGLSPALVDPTESAALIPIVFIFIVFIVSGLLALWFHIFPLGIVLIVLGFYFTRLCRRQIDLRIKGWEKMQAKYKFEKDRIMQEIKRF